MEGESYIYHLNTELLENERIFKLSSALLNKDNSLVITLIVNAKDYDNKLSAELKDKVRTVTRKLVPECYNPKILFKKTISDESYINQLINDFFYKESPLVLRKLSDCSITTETGYDTITVNLDLPPYLYSFMEKNGYAEKLAGFLNSEIMETVEVALTLNTKSDKQASLIKRKPQEHKTSLKIIEVYDLKSVVGAISRMPKYISEALKAESENQTVCGKVSQFSQKVSKNTGKPFFTMKLDDTTGQIEAVFFAKDEASAESFAREIYDGALVCVEGPVKLSTYTGSFTLQIRRISTCAINYASIKQDIDYYEESDEYMTISPEPYIDEEQLNLFDDELPAPEALKGDYVIFDLETTGLNPTTDKIIEIGAVKMRDGRLIETFSTLINPECHIPEAASATNNIFDKDVADAPTLDKVIGDFYKFTRNATLVGHNAEAFDYSFLAYWGKQHRYNFDNAISDTLKIAKEKGVKGKLNLGTLCDKFDIPLDKAHRALYDAVATAKLFRKLIVL